jgi:hypothetical protein
MMKNVKQMTDEQIGQEYVVLTLLKNSLARFIPQDDKTRLLINVVDVDLKTVSKEYYKRQGYGE